MSRSSTFWITLTLVSLLLLVWLRDSLSRRAAGRLVKEDELEGLGARLRRAYRDNRSNPDLAAARKLTLAETALASGRILRIFRDLDGLAKKHGRGGRKSSSPLDLVADLKPVFPGREADLQEITKAYLRLERGLLPEYESQVHTIEKAWLRLRAQSESGYRKQPTGALPTAGHLS